MDEKRILNFESNMSAFTYGFIQDVLTFLTTLKDRGLTIDDVKDYHQHRMILNAKRQQEIIKEIQKRGPTLNCPECPAIMLAIPVNTGPGDQTGDINDKSVWLCQNQECMHTIYNKETVEEIAKLDNIVFDGQ